MIRDISEKSAIAAKADAAFEQASKKVIQRARQTGTPVVLWKDGRIEQIPSEQVGTAIVQSGSSQPDV